MPEQVNGDRTVPGAPTVSGTALGTPSYMAPEQARNARLATTTADVYSLGAILYECLTGQPPFPEATVAEKLIAHQTKKPRAIRELRPEVPAGVAKIIERMMAKDPKDRFQTPEEIVEVAEEIDAADMPLEVVESTELADEVDLVRPGRR